MHDARDVEDKRLLEAGDHKLLLAGYFHAVRELCFLRLRDREAADEAAQIVFLRLFRELKRGKTYSVPFRVVVWKVVEWTVRGFYPGAKADDTLPDDWDPAAGARARRGDACPHRGLANWRAPARRPARDSGHPRRRSGGRTRRDASPRPSQAREGEALLPASGGRPARAQSRQPKGLGRRGG